MKFIMEFDIPEDQSDFEAAMNGHKYKRAIRELDEWLRHCSKSEQPDSLYGFISKARNNIADSLDGLDLYD